MWFKIRQCPVFASLHQALQAKLAITERRDETIVAAELIQADGFPNKTAGQAISGRARHYYWGKMAGVR